MEMFMTAEQSSGSPKRVTRRRTKKVEATESNDLRESGLSEAQSPKPLIEDVFDEIRAVRAETEGYPTEQDMDFESLEQAPAPRRSRARRTESTESQTRSTSESRASGEPRAASSQPRRTRAPRRTEAAAETPAPSEAGTRESARETLSRETLSRESSVQVESRTETEKSSAADFHDNVSEGRRADYASDIQGDASGGASGSSGGPNDYPTGPEGFQDGGQNRRRRRRRGRGRGTGPAENSNYGGQTSQRPQQGRYNQGQGGGGGGYGQQSQGRGGHRRPQQDNRRSQYNNGGGQNARSHSEPRGNQERGPETVTLVQGILELHPKGYGFLRDPKAGYVSQETDSFVSGSLLEKYGIREGVLITGESIPGGRGQGPRLRSIQSIEGRLPELYAEVKNFDSLTPINPNVQIKLETGANPITMRVMDLLTPIGKGQRALIVAPPRSGKTMLLQEIADSVSTNYPDIYLIVLLIDERPEEVTEMRRRVKGEVVASSLDREVENHIRVSQLVFERAKRMAESGRDVFVLLDSITRTARAFNKWTNTGRTGTGGLDVKAMDIPKKMFGMARQFDEGGSLTVVGTALVETGSRMDEAIFLEFKGTGNMEMVLSRDLAERRIWPAIDISRSGTRREEKILSPDVLEGVTLLRRSLISLSPVEAMEQLTRILQKYPTNADFLAKVRSIL